MKVYILLGGLFALCSGLQVVDKPGSTVEKVFETESGKVTLIVGNKKGRALNNEKVSEEVVPKPIEIRSDSLTVKNGQEGQQRRGRKVHQTMSIDSEGIPVIEGVREADDPADIRVFRNARVINNVLVTAEDDVKNQIAVDEDEPIQLSGRQGRILTGSFDEVKALPLSQENPGAEAKNEEGYEQIYYKHYYDPSRVGLIDPAPPTKNPKEKVVTYSYSTSGGGIKQETSKDVVYGSGFAAIPSFKPKTPSPSPQASVNSPKFQPPQFWTGFEPSSNVDSFSNSKPPQKRLAENHSSSSSFKFHDPSLQSQSASTTVFKVQPVPLNVDSNQQQNFKKHQQFQQQQQQQRHSQQQNQQNQFQQQQQEDYFQQQYQQRQQHKTQQQIHSQPRPSTPKRWVEFQKPAVNNPVTYSDPSQPSFHSNSHESQRRVETQRNGFPQRIPTPQEAFGEAGSYVHPDVVQVSPDNFIVERQTFQSHPGAPTFSVPVPRQKQQNEYAVQQYDYQQQQQQSYYEDPYATYPYYYEEVDNRPIIEKLMDPVRRVGEKVKEITNPVFGRFRIPERIDKIASGTVDADAIPLFAGAAAVATLGALGAFAASKYSFADISKLLPATGTRSVKNSVSDTLQKIASDLNSEDPDFMKKFTSSTSWLESNCSSRVFCSLITTSMKEEEEKLDKKVQALIVEKGMSPEEAAALKSRQARDFVTTDVVYLEKQMKDLIDKSLSTDKKRKELQRAADNVLMAVRQRDCSAFACDSKRKN